MSNPIQVTFNPAIWSGGTGAGTSPGSNGYDAFSVFLDNDGKTAWAFENSAAGFARFNLLDGSIIFQGALFNTPGISKFLDQNSTMVLFAQDDLGFYYTIYNQVLYKSHVAPGPSNNLWNGYMTVDASVSLAGLFTSWGPGFAFGWTQNIVAASDGNRYIALSFTGSCKPRQTIVVSVSTMTVVGVYAPPEPLLLESVGLPFLDSNKDFWFFYNDPNLSTSQQYQAVKWHPADGVTSGNLNVTINYINPSVFTSDVSWLWALSVPSNNSMLVGSNKKSVTFPSTGYMANVSLSTFSQNAFMSIDATTWYVDAGADLPNSAILRGVTGNGLVGIPGDVSGEVVQKSGILNIFDPVALKVTATLNLTSLINATSGLTPVPKTGSVYNDPATMQYNGNYLVVAYNNSSPVYIFSISVGLCGAATPKGNPLIRRGK